MVEVFKTNVDHPEKALWLLDRIHLTLDNCTASFDLEDCDRILRIASKKAISPDYVIALLDNLGFKAEILPD